MAKLLKKDLERIIQEQQKTIEKLQAQLPVDNKTTESKKEEEKVMNIIKEFRGDYYFLSNFYPVSIKVEDNTYSSVEAAYQAMKCKTKDQRKQFVGLSAVQAKRLGKQIPLRDNWDKEKFRVMKHLLEIKFSNKNLKKRLKETGDAFITHENYWKDTYWGVYKGKGKDILGKLLMQIRDSK